MTQVRALLWDIGQVVYPSPFERFDELEEHVGLPAGVLPRGPFSAAGDPGYAEVDLGSRREAEYWRDVHETGRAYSSDFDMHASLRSLGWRGAARPEVVELLADLHRRYRQGVLTNDASAFLGVGWHQDWELLEYFDVIVDSLDIGVRKPHAAAYAAGVAALGVTPAEVVFVDDLTVNVEAARMAGLQAVRFDTTDVAAGVDAVRAALGLGPALSTMRQ